MKAQSKNYILLICLYIPNIGYKSSLLQAGSYIFMIILIVVRIKEMQKQCHACVCNMFTICPANVDLS